MSKDVRDFLLIVGSGFAVVGIAATGFVLFVAYVVILGALVS